MREINFSLKRSWSTHVVTSVGNDGKTFCTISKWEKYYNYTGHSRDMTRFSGVAIFRLKNCNFWTMSVPPFISKHHRCVQSNEIFPWTYHTLSRYTIFIFFPPYFVEEYIIIVNFDENNFQIGYPIFCLYSNYDTKFM